MPRKLRTILTVLLCMFLCVFMLPINVTAQEESGSEEIPTEYAQEEDDSETSAAEEEESEEADQKESAEEETESKEEIEEPAVTEEEPVEEEVQEPEAAEEESEIEEEIKEPEIIKEAEKEQETEGKAAAQTGGSTMADAVLLEQGTLTSVDVQKAEQWFYFNPDLNSVYKLTVQTGDADVYPDITIYDQYQNQFGHLNKQNKIDSYNYEISVGLFYGETYYIKADTENRNGVAEQTYQIRLEKTPSVIYHANGGTFSDNADFRYGYYLPGDSEYLGNNIPSREGYKFSYWTGSDGNTYYDGDSIYIGSNDYFVELYAEWEPRLALTFDAGDGYFEVDDGAGGLTQTKTKTLYYDEWAYIGQSPCIPKHDTLAFKGWYTDPEFINQVIFEEGYGVESNVTFYANYDTPVIFTFNLNGGSVNEDTSNIEKYFTYGGLISTGDITPEKPGYVFLGWGTDPNASDGESLYGRPIDRYTPTTYYAIWAKNATLTLNAGEGYFDQYEDEDGNVVYERNKVIESHVGVRFWEWDLNSPYHDSLMFAGWYTDPALTNKADLSDDGYLLTDDSTLYARFATPIEITFDLNGGYFEREECAYDDDNYECNYIPDTSPVIKQAVIGRRVQMWDRPSRVGYGFRGWSADPNADPKEVEGWVDITVTSDTPTTYYAIWTKQFNITLNGNGGGFKQWTYDPDTYEYIYEIVDETTTDYYEGVRCYVYGSFEAPVNADPDKQFLGWSLKQNPTEDDLVTYVTFTADTTLYAVWADIPEIQADTEYKMESPGYTKWFKFVPEESGKYTIRSSKLFAGNPYAALYDSGKNSLTNSWKSSLNMTYSMTAGETYYYALIADYEPVGYSFKVTKAVMHTVTYNANGGYFGTASVVTKQSEFAKDQTFISKFSPVNQDVNLLFAGWADSPDATKPNVDYRIVVESDMTVYAVWSPKITIYFDAGTGFFEFEDPSGEGYIREKETYQDRIAGSELGGTSQLPNPCWDDYDITFIGWSLDPNSDEIVDREYKITESVRLYAVYKPLHVNLTFDAMDGTINGQHTITEEHWSGYEYTIHDLGYSPELSGKVFENWYFDQDLTQPLEEGKLYRLTDSITLYARYTDPLTVTAHLNGGTFDGSGITSDPDEIKTVAIAENALMTSIYGNGGLSQPNRSGYLFRGWSLVKDGDPIYEYDYYVTSDLDIYAVWIPAVQVTFDANGGYFPEANNNSSVTKEFGKGDMLSSIYTVPEYFGYVGFAGWALTKDGEDILPDHYKVESDITVYAKWNEYVTVQLAAADHLRYASWDDNGRERKQSTYSLDVPKGVPLSKYIHLGFELSDDYVYYLEWYEDEGLTQRIDDLWEYVATENTVIYPKVGTRPARTGINVTVNKYSVAPNGYEINIEESYVNLNTDISIEAEPGKMVSINVFGDPVHSVIDFSQISCEVISGNGVNNRGAGGDITAFGFNYRVVSNDPTVIKLEYYGNIRLIYINAPLPVPVTGISLDQTALTLTEEDTARLTAAVLPENAGNKAITWTSSDETVAAVDSEGNVTALKAGTAVITAASAEDAAIKATCTVTVNKKPVQAEEIVPETTSLELSVGEEKTISVTVNPADAEDKTVTWTSGDESIATVDENGKVKALKAGTAVITVTSVSSPAVKAEVTVTVIGTTVTEPEISTDADPTIKDAIEAEEDPFGLNEELADAVSDTAQFLNDLGIDIGENTGEENKVVVQTYIAVDELTVTQEEDKPVLTVDLTPKYKVVELEKGADDASAGTLIEEGKLEIKKEITVRIPVGNIFGDETKTVYIKHVKDNDVKYFYEGTYADGIVTFVNPDGFSEFIIQTEDFPASDKTSIENTEVVLSADTFTYNAKVQKPSIVTIDGKELKEGRDYTAEWLESKNAGTYAIRIIGKGNYAGETSATYTITPKKITPTVTLSKTELTYNGKVQKPTVTVKYGKTKLTYNTHYTVAFQSGRKNVGVYKVTVKLKGNYSGTKTVTFKINPKGTTLKSVSALSKGFTVTWNKQSAKMATSVITGYQIQIATDAKFTKGKKLITAAKYTTVSKKITGLKAKTKYYVRIRTYKTVNKVKYYSPWAKAKYVTTK